MFPWDGDEPLSCRALARSTFAALARTCKYLYPFGMRFLYESYEGPVSGRLGHFLRTLHNHSELLSRVREILVCDHLYDGLALRNDFGLSQAEMTEHIRTLSLPYESALVDAVSRHPEEVELALSVLDARCSLQVLGILHHCHCDQTPHRALWLTPLLYAAQHYAYAPNDTSNGFARLRYLALDMTGVSMADIAPVLLLPLLKTLELHGPSSEIDHGSWGIHPRSSKVQSITITSSFEPPLDHIQQLLQSCEAVHEFRCDRPDIPETNIMEWHSAILEAVRPHEGTLKKLELRTGETSRFDWTDSWPRNNSLSEMRELKDLELHYTAVVGKERGLHNPTLPDQQEAFRSLHDLLPPNLIELRLRYSRSAMNVDVDYNAELRCLLQDGSSRHRKLKKVWIHYFHDTHYAQFPLSLHSLQEYFKAQDVEFYYTINYALQDEGKCSVCPQVWSRLTALL
jgi:hypothetical protein